jgi:glucoamylase
MDRRPLSLLATGGLLLGAALSGLLAVPGADAAPPPPSAASDGPGVLSRFDLARKDCLGTARNSTSKVWYTVADGVLSDVYEPTIDNTNVSTLQYVVTDGHSFTDLQTRDLTYRVSADRSGMECTVVATSAAHGYQLTTTYLTDTARDSVVMHTTISPVRHSHTDVSKLAVYARLDAHVNGNGGGGSANGGADNGVVAGGVPVVSDTGVVSQADNRDYAVPTFMALASSGQSASSVGYAGVTSDPLTQLDADHRISQPHSGAPDGHVVAATRLAPRHGELTLALGFGRNQSAALNTARSSADASFRSLESKYTKTWRSYDKGLRQPRSNASSYWLSANVLKASEDKTFPGAVVASLASPWGQAVSAGDLPGGKPVYFGSYREVFARDLYEAATGMIADGDVGTARAATRFLFDRQQQATGAMPRNSLLNGKTAPDTGGIQLDESAYPILMAYLTGLSHDASLYTGHIRPAADYLVSHGPSFGNERWEEQGGFSPSTIAAEIAGLTAAAHIANVQHDPTHAALYQAVADQSQTVTHTGPYSSSPYFIRLSKNGDPDSAVTYNLGNGSIDIDQRAVVDGGFQDLVRLGELPVNDADVQNSLTVLDHQISVSTPTGTGYYRYGNDATLGSADGYGDCFQPSQTSCSGQGQPWPTTDVGTGHLWPVLSGERAETALAGGDRSLARAQLRFMEKSASGVGLVPEQVWEDPDLAASPYGTDPTTASIGFQDGHAAGSASPLTWAEGQEVRLIVDLDKSRITDRPDITNQRYVAHAPPANVPVSITSPTDGASVSGTVQVSGQTASGASVVVSSIGNDVTSSDVEHVTADSGGAYSATVPVSFGADVITVAATTSAGTGTAQVNVVGDLVGGTTVLDTADPANDDNGPGTYAYPTAADFVAGSYDITRFQVLEQGDTAYLRTTLRTLVPTFGSPMGAQLLDVYVHDPAASSTSTSAAYPSRNYTIASGDAWSQRLEVQGFASPVWQDPDGNQVGAVTAVVASQAAKTITIAVPAAELGNVSSGWSFAVVLTGQDGFSSDQARAFQSTPQDFQFGVCAPGGTSPICAVDPGTVAKAMDVITPAGVDQATELDLTQGPVVIRGVPVS